MTAATIQSENIIFRRYYDNMMRDLYEIIPYLEDPATTNISVLGSGEITVKQFGRQKQFTGKLLTQEHVMRIIRAITSILNKTIDEKKAPRLYGVIPVFNARITALLPPWVQRPEFTIRKPPSVIYTLEDYVRDEIMTDKQHDMLIQAIEERKNILIGGATDCGKTTLLNAVLREMVRQTPDERFYVVEDVPELQCTARDITFVCTEPEQTIEAVRTSLRWSVERIIFGELRYGEVTNELLKGWNTGHRGNAATIHANSAESMLIRVRDLLREVIHGELPRISDAIQVCVHLTKINNKPRISDILQTENSDMMNT